jgi:hypothetical protein
VDTLKTRLNLLPLAVTHLRTRIIDDTVSFYSVQKSLHLGQTLYLGRVHLILTRRITRDIQR